MTRQFDHLQKDKVGVLITNLGTPEAPTAPALRTYLREFLSDPRVIEVPRLLWWLILHGVILRVRPRKSAEAYKSVWTESGSPLALHTASQAEALQKRMHEKYGDQLMLTWGMRYGKPSISHRLHSMLDQGVRKVLVLPLYPQYSASTTGSTFDAIAKDFTQRRWIPDLRFVSQYSDHPLYIDALAASIRRHWQTHGRPDKLVFSYHGIPLRYFKNGDPYHCFCHKTTRLVAEKMNLAQSEYLTTFQSRFGREEWMKPYTDETMKALPSENNHHVQVICPGFSADCLETLEEIAVENKEYFIEAGGETFSYIPALNSEELHINALENILETHLQGWLPMPESNEQQRNTLAEQHPHNR